VQEQRLDGAQLVNDEGRDVPIAAVFAQQGLRVPQHQVRVGRPGQGGMGGEEGSPLGPLGSRLGGVPGDT